MDKFTSYLNAFTRSNLPDQINADRVFVVALYRFGDDIPGMEGLGTGEYKTSFARIIVSQYRFDPLLLPVVSSYSR